jgi:hypothetical protein
VGGKGPSSSTTQTEKNLTEDQIALAKKQDDRSQQIFDLSLPGLKTATAHYTKLASGDPNAISTEVGPGTQKIAEEFDSAKQSISETTPRGGARDLALQEADISKAGAIGNVTNQAYEGAFPALAALSGKGVGLSINEMSNAIAAFGGASNTAANLANQQEAGKAATLGFIGSLAGSGAEGAALAV